MFFIPRWEKYQEPLKDRFVEIDYGHELAVGLRNAFIFNNQESFDLVEQQTGVETNVSYSDDAAVFDKTAKINLANPAPIANGEISIAFRAVRNEIAVGGIYGDKDASNWTSNAGFALFFMPDGIHFAFSTSNIAHASSQFFNQTQVKYSGLAVASLNSNGEIFQNGSPVTVTSDTASAITQSAVPAKIGTTFDEAADKFLDGEIDYLYVFDKRYGQEFADALHENPYQLLKPRKKFFVLDESAVQPAVVIRKPEYTATAPRRHYKAVA